MDSKELDKNEQGLPKPEIKYSVGVRGPAIQELHNSMMAAIQSENQATSGSYKDAQRLMRLKQQLAAAMAESEKSNSAKLDLSSDDIRLLKTELRLDEEAGHQEEGDRRGRREIIDEIEANYRNARTMAKIKSGFRSVSGFFRRK